MVEAKNFTLVIEFFTINTKLPVFLMLASKIFTAAKKDTSSETLSDDH